MRLQSSVWILSVETLGHQLTVNIVTLAILKSGSSRDNGLVKGRELQFPHPLLQVSVARVPSYCLRMDRRSSFHVMKLAIVGCYHVSVAVGSILLDVELTQAEGYNSAQTTPI